MKYYLLAAAPLPSILNESMWLQAGGWIALIWVMRHLMVKVIPGMQKNYSEEMKLLRDSQAVNNARLANAIESLKEKD